MRFVVHARRILASEGRPKPSDVVSFVLNSEVDAHRRFTPTVCGGELHLGRTFVGERIEAPMIRDVIEVVYERDVRSDPVRHLRVPKSPHVIDNFANG